MKYGIGKIMYVSASDKVKEMLDSKLFNNTRKDLQLHFNEIVKSQEEK